MKKSERLQCRSRAEARLDEARVDEAMMPVRACSLRALRVQSWRSVPMPARSLLTASLISGAGLKETSGRQIRLTQPSNRSSLRSLGADQLEREARARFVDSRFQGARDMGTAGTLGARTRPSAQLKKGG
jgi:hypothetical protein